MSDPVAIGYDSFYTYLDTDNKQYYIYVFNNASVLDQNNNPTSYITLPQNESINVSFDIVGAGGGGNLRYGGAGGDYTSISPQKISDTIYINVGHGGSPNNPGNNTTVSFNGTIYGANGGISGPDFSSNPKYNGNFFYDILGNIYYYGGYGGNGGYLSNGQNGGSSNGQNGIGGGVGNDGNPGSPGGIGSGGGGGGGGEISILGQSIPNGIGGNGGNGGKNGGGGGGPGIPFNGNFGGNGGDGLIVVTVTIYIPDRPVNVSPTPGNGSASVSWTAPAYDGGSAITGYDVLTYYSPDNSIISVNNISDPTQLTFIQSGLTNGSSYYFAVRAVNNVGTGLLRYSSVIIPATVPDAPTNVSATAGNGSATVSWTAPANDGGSAIISYTVTSTPGNFTATTLDGSTTTATVTGLTNGTAYTFTVTATNSIGNSDISAPSNSVIQTTVPGAPTNVQVKNYKKNNFITVSWRRPSNNGGSTITNYIVTVFNKNKVVRTINTNNSSFTFRGLQKGKPYQFTVTAVNSVGPSSPSSKSNTIKPNSIALSFYNIPVPRITHWHLLQKMNFH